AVWGDGAGAPKVDKLPASIRPLVRRNAVEVRNTNFGRDAEALANKVGEALKGVQPATGRWPFLASGAAWLMVPGRWRTVAGSATALLLVGWIGLYQIGVPVWVPWAADDRADKTKTAADAEAKRKAAEAEQQRLKEEEQRQAQAAADAEAKRKAAEAEQVRVKEEEQRQAKAAANAEARRKAEESEQQQLADAEAEREAPGLAAVRTDASKVLGITEVQWKQIFDKDGRTYRTPELVLYRGTQQASCGGAAQSAMG